MDELEVSGLDEVPVADALGDGEQFVRVTAAQHRVEESAVGDQVEAMAGVGVATVELQIQRDRTLGLVPHFGADGLRHQTMRQIQVVDRREGAGTEAQARRVLLGSVAQVGRTPRLVQRGPGVDAVAEALGHDTRVVGERIGGSAVQPAALVAEVLRQIPVVQRHDRLDAGLQQGVHDAFVEVEAFFVGHAIRRRYDAGHGDREAVGVHAEVLEQREVLAPTMVGIGGHIAGVAGDGGSRRMAEGVPDGGATAILGHRAFDLIGRCGRAECEILWKS